MRVVAGTLRGRPIVAPAGSATRPTTDRVREALFNALESIGAIEDASVIDLFAGSGALGIEALSRGARRCTFVERDRDALRSIRTNLEKLGLEDRTSVSTGDVLSSIGAFRGIDLVLVDPPYGFEAWPRLLDAVVAMINPDAIVVLESDRAVELPTGWEEVRAKRYGRTWVTFVRRVLEV